MTKDALLIVKMNILMKDFQIGLMVVPHIIDGNTWHDFCTHEIDIDLAKNSIENLNACMSTGDYCPRIDDFYEYLRKECCEKEV